MKQKEITNEICILGGYDKVGSGRGGKGIEDEGKGDKEMKRS